MQTLRRTPDLSTQNLHFNKTPGGSCVPRVEKQCARAPDVKARVTGRHHPPLPSFRCCRSGWARGFACLTSSQELLGHRGLPFENCGPRHLALGGIAWSYFRIIWMLKIV